MLSIRLRGSAEEAQEFARRIQAAGIGIEIQLQGSKERTNRETGEPAGFSDSYGAAMVSGFEASPDRAAAPVRQRHTPGRRRPGWTAR